MIAVWEWHNGISTVFTIMYYCCYADTGLNQFSFGHWISNYVMSYWKQKFETGFFWLWRYHFTILLLGEKYTKNCLLECTSLLGFAIIFILPCMHLAIAVIVYAIFGMHLFMLLARTQWRLYMTMHDTNFIPITS